MEKKNKETILLPKDKLIKILRADTFSAEEFPQAKSPSQKLKQLINAIEKINLYWQQESYLYQLQTLHAFLVYLVSEITRTLGASKESDLDLSLIDTLFKELIILLNNFKPHHQSKGQEQHIPIDQLLLAFSQHKSCIVLKEADNLYEKMNNLLQTWGNFTKHLATAELANIAKALGSFAAEGFFYLQRFNIGSLVKRVDRNIKARDYATDSLLLWLNGCSILAKSQSLGRSLPVAHINLILVLLAERELTVQQADKFVDSLTDLLESWAIENSEILKYPELERLLGKVLKQNVPKQIVANIVIKLKKITDFLESAEKMSITLLDDLVSCLIAQVPKELEAQPLESQIAWAKAISKTTNIGEIVKTNPFLYASISPKLKSNIDYLMAVLNTIRKSINAKIPKDSWSNPKSIQCATYQDLIYAIVVALRNYVLLGFSTPCAACQEVSLGAGSFLKDFPQAFTPERRILLASLYALYVYGTQKSDEKFPTWLLNILDPPKPKSPAKDKKPAKLEEPESDSYQAKTVKLLKERGCQVKTEVFFGPYACDLSYIDKKSRKKIVEFNGDLYHIGRDHRHEPKDLFKSYILAYRGIPVIFFDLDSDKRTPEQLVNDLLSDKRAEDSKMASKTAETLGEFIKRKYSKNRDFWEKTPVGKIASGLAEPAPTPTVTSSIPEDTPSLLGPDFTEAKSAEQEKKYHQHVSNNLKQFMDKVRKGDISVTASLDHGHLINPHTGQKDPLITVCALFCAMEELLLINEDTRSAKKTNLQKIIEALIGRVSIKSLYEVDKDLGSSPLILAIKCEVTTPEIYQSITARLSLSFAPKQKRRHQKRDKSLEKAPGDLQTILKEAREAAQKLDSVPHIDYTVWLQQTKKSVPKPEPTLETRSFRDVYNVAQDPFLTPIHIPPDKLLRSAEKGYPASQFFYALCAYHGKNMAVNYKLAAYWLVPAATQGHSAAQYLLGIFYGEGLGGLEKDLKKAKYYTDLSAKQGCLNALNQLARFYEAEEGLENAKQALAYDQITARQGHAVGQFQLARAYETGREGVVKKDPLLARRFYDLSAKQNYHPARCIVGEFQYAKGDFKNALANFEIASRFISSRYYLGMIYAEGKGVPQNFAKADLYFNLFIELMVNSVNLNREEIIVGTSMDKITEFLSEIGMQYKRNSNAKRAAYFFDLAAQRGDARSQYVLGVQYYKGTGVTPNIKKAVEYWQLAAAQGYEFAQSDLGTLYIKGAEGIPPNVIQGLALLEQAVAQDIDIAQYNLACFLEDGKQIKRDFNRAFDLYKKSAKQGYEPAIEKLITIQHRIKFDQLPLDILYDEKKAPQKVTTPSTPPPTCEPKPNTMPNEAKIKKLQADNTAAIQAMQRGEFPKAIGLFQSIVEYWDTIADALTTQKTAVFNLGACLFKAQQYDKACIHLQRAVSLALKEKMTDDLEKIDPKYRDRLEKCKSLQEEQLSISTGATPSFRQ